MQSRQRLRPRPRKRGEPGVSVPRKAARRLPSGGVMRLAHLPGDAVVPCVAARLLSAWRTHSAIDRNPTIAKHPRAVMGGAQRRLLLRMPAYADVRDSAPTE